jgi:hypothetical protein
MLPVVFPEEFPKKFDQNEIIETMDQAIIRKPFSNFLDIF